MSKFVIMIFLLSTLGCSNEPITSIESDFIPYLNYFQDLHAGAIPPLIIQFNYTGDKIGVCSVYSNGQRQIKVDRAFWDTLCEDQKRGLLMHELGHCVLGREHGTGLTYMVYNLQSCAYYDTNEAALNNELFN